MTDPSAWTPPPPPPPVPGSYPAPPPAMIRRRRGPMVGFQSTLLVWFGLGAFWATFGRFFFGVGGWFGLFMMLSVLPAVAIYAIVLQVVVLVRYNKNGYVLQRWTAASFIAALAGLAVAGFTIVDFGDAPGSVNSLLTAALGADPQGLVGTVSTVLAWGGLGVALVGMIAGFVLMFVEKPKGIGSAGPAMPTR